MDQHLVEILRGSRTRDECAVLQEEVGLGTYLSPHITELRDDQRAVEGKLARPVQQHGIRGRIGRIPLVADGLVIEVRLLRMNTEC